MLVCVCVFVKSLYSRFSAETNATRRPFPFSHLVSSCCILGAMKKVHILCVRLVTAGLSVYDFQHPGYQTLCTNAPRLHFYLAVYL